MAKSTLVPGRRFDRRVLWRVVIYMAATHAFLGFLALLFEIGARKG
ncbi:DUF6126 family protein [Kitasatospora sp. NPDC004289]